MQSGAEQGKHGLITGGSAGLGLAIARAAAAQGMKVTLVGRNAGRLKAAGNELMERYPGSLFGERTADLAVPGEPTRLICEVQEEQPLDFVCHAAGLSARGRIVETSRDEFERLMAINFFAAAELAGALGESFASSKGRLVLIGSLASRVAPANLGAYPASKHPLAALAQQLRMELGPQGLRTLLVLPGPIARDDAGERYNDQAADLPAAAKRPGGGANVRALDPDRLARQILAASRAGKAELVTPLKSRLLFALAQLSPGWGDWLLRRSMRG
ncbi:3-oxoacyl-[acyl-carrier-protein] reductase FabG1 [Planctomycetes bacterium MalM25]|nr:3-oxoacyl-[acyl-carrier-protein] reductase FabG1 [Planctomycetes bacterium MalM25]